MEESQLYRYPRDAESLRWIVIAACRAARLQETLLPELGKRPRAVAPGYLRCLRIFTSAVCDWQYGTEYRSKWHGAFQTIAQVTASESPHTGF
ncbi:hypothetical protein VTG60DRAFT_1016 [Thermothelomyces hinnuleus]